MAFVTTIEEFKQCVPSLYSTSVKNLPDMSSAIERMLLPILGQPLLEMLEAGESLSDTAAKMAVLCKKVICPWALLENVDLLQVSFSDNGLIAIEPENSRKAYKWESNLAKDALIDRAFRAQESLIKLLLDNASIFPDWELSEYRKSAFPLIRNGAELREQVFVDQPHRSYMILRPLLEESVDIELPTVFGEEFVADFLDKVKDSSLNSDEKALATLIRKASARIAMMKAARLMTVRYQPGAGFVVIQNTKDAAYDGSKSASQTEIAPYIREMELTSQAYLSRAVELLNTKASTELFPLWFNSDKYNNPNQPNNNLKNGRQGMFCI